MKARYVVLFLTICGIILWKNFSFQENESQALHQTEQSNTPMRSIASIPPTHSPKQNKIPHAHTKIKNEIKVFNTPKDNWQELYQERISQNLLEMKEIKVKKLESFVYDDQLKKLHVHKVQVTLTKNDGETSSYHALVDAGNGAQIHTWNQTRYEFNKSLEFKPRDF
jgi:hypothetical protein